MLNGIEKMARSDDDGLGRGTLLTQGIVQFVQRLMHKDEGIVDHVAVRWLHR